jgi:hypothetical protein
MAQTNLDFISFALKKELLLFVKSEKMYSYGLCLSVGVLVFSNALFAV